MLLFEPALKASRGTSAKFTCHVAIFLFIAEASGRLRGSFLKALGKLQGGLGKVSGRFRGGFGKVSGRFRKGFGKVSGRFQGGFGKVFREVVSLT